MRLVWSEEIFLKSHDKGFRPQSDNVTGERKHKSRISPEDDGPGARLDANHSKGLRLSGSYICLNWPLSNDADPRTKAAPKQEGAQKGTECAPRCSISASVLEQHTTVLAGERLEQQLMDSLGWQFTDGSQTRRRAIPTKNIGLWRECCTNRQ